MNETPTHEDDRASTGAWLGCLMLLLVGSLGCGIGLVVMSLLTQ